MPEFRSNLQKIVVIGGPTCSGKSDLAYEIAKNLDGEILNADSMQLYRHFDIGTAKPRRELRDLVPHHLLDIVEPNEPFDAKRFIDEADRVIRDIVSRGRIPIVVGGTGLYLRALLYGLFEAKKDEKLRAQLMDEYKRDPMSLYRKLSEIDTDYAKRISPTDRIRVVRALEVYFTTGKTVSQLEREHGFKSPRYEAFFIGLTRERRELYLRINKRVDRMLKDGWVEEVRRILDMGYDERVKPLRSIGYYEITQYLKGNLTYDEMVRLIKKKTRAYAKRQLTWFRKEKGIRWYMYPEDKERILKELTEFLKDGR